MLLLRCLRGTQVRKGYSDGEDCAHTILPKVTEWGAAAATLHGRTRQQRWVLIGGRRSPGRSWLVRER